MTVLSFPDVGTPMPVGGSNADVLAFMTGRKSPSIFTLEPPGPNDAELDAILRLGARVPDHGRLMPWRFIVLRGEAKQGLVARLAPLVEHQATPSKAEASLRRFARSPVSIVVVSRTIEAHIPEWEQQLSAGAACFSLLLAAHAHGYGANWVTGWFAYDEDALEAFGVASGDRIAGFIQIGNASEAPAERPRPDMSAIVTWPEREVGE